MSRSEALVALFLLGATATANAAPWSGLGAPLTATEISSWDIDVRPDGKGLPPGRGNAMDGQAIYDAQCASCHGTFGESNDYLALTGGIGSLATAAPQRTVASKLNYATTLWDYINRAMPFPHSKSLTVDEVYAVTAYVLNLAEILPMDAELDEKTLPAVVMPNREGFTLEHGFSEVGGTPDVKATACMKACATEVAVASELPAGFTAEMYGDIRTHFRALAGMTEAAPTTATAGSPATPSQLAATRGCLTCHGVDRAVVGPAFTAVAERYAGEAGASTTLSTKIRQGGSGVWGSAMMPAQTAIPDPELAAVVAWILAGAKPE